MLRFQAIIFAQTGRHCGFNSYDIRVLKRLRFKRATARCFATPPLKKISQAVMTHDPPFRSTGTWSRWSGLPGIYGAPRSPQSRRRHRRHRRVHPKRRLPRARAVATSCPHLSPMMVSNSSRNACFHSSRDRSWTRSPCSP